MVDGNYQLTIDSSKVKVAGTNRTMLADYVFGDDEDDGFYSYFGDNNGDRSVGVLDLFAFRQTYRKNVGDAGYNVNFDYNGDGTVSVLDLFHFRSRYTRRLDFV